MIDTDPYDSYLPRDARFFLTREARDFYKIIEDPSNQYFKQHSDAFMASMALGITNHKYIEGKKKDADLMILAVYRAADPRGIFPLLVKAIHPELDKKQLVDRMEDYALAGVEELREQYEKLGRIDFALLKELSKE
jgi:hypothetical protein